MGWEWDRDYPAPRPRRAANGIRAQSQRGAFAKNWWASRWIAALERLAGTGRLARGRSYARSGQVVELDVGAAGIRARVQGSRVRPYSVRITVATIAADAWERVIDAMAAEASYAALLLAGEMPEEIETAFERAGVSLLPQARADLVSECSCPDWANPCKHVAAVHYILGERFDADPFLMFLLRGRSKDDILAALRVRRAAAAGVSVAETPADWTAMDPPGESLATFWSMPVDVGEIPLMTTEMAPPVDAFFLKRRGPPPFDAPEPQFTSRMEAIYRAAAAEAQRLALGETEGE